MIYGYARVSTGSQSAAAQVAALEAAGAEKVFQESRSGENRDRRELARVLKALGDGDLLLVTRLDRLARSSRDLLNILHELGQRGAAFRSLADAWADTTTPHGRLMVTVLGGLAEFERELIMARTREGRERAKARGVKMGRPSRLSAHQRGEILARKEAGEPLRDIALTYGVHFTTIGKVKP